MDFVPVARVTELAASKKMCLEVNGHFVVLVALEDEIFCLDDICTHDGGPLGEGDIEDHCLVCPRHGAKFNIRTGAAVCMPATEPTLTHDVRIEGDQILVRLNSQSIR